MAEAALEEVELPEAWGVLDDDGEPDAAADQRLTDAARQLVEGLRRAAGDEASSRAALMGFYRSWEALCDENGSASDTDVRECVHSVFEELVEAAGFSGRAPRWWDEAWYGYLDVEVPGWEARVGGMAARSAMSPETLTSELARLVTGLTERLESDDEAALPGVGTFRKRRGSLAFRRWPAEEDRDEDEPPRPPVAPSVQALLEDVRVNGAVQVPGLGIVGRRVYPGYEGRNPKTGQTIQVAEKAIITCLPDEALVSRIDAAG
jgi:nucleoid DNA-binding protein